MNSLVFAAVAEVCSMTTAFADVASGSNGATGNIYNADLKARTFDLLKQTECDPKTDIGKSFWQWVLVMRRLPEILINDLNGVVSQSPAYGNRRNGTDVHFYQKCKARIARLHSCTSCQGSS